jgi:hypothetical protein
MNPLTVLYAALRTLGFKMFTPLDWDAYAGAASFGGGYVPLMAEFSAAGVTEDGEVYTASVLVIVDANGIELRT